MVHDVFAVCNSRLNKIFAHRFATRIASLRQFDRGHNETDNFHKPNTTGCEYFFLNTSLHTMAIGQIGIPGNTRPSRHVYTKNYLIKRKSAAVYPCRHKMSVHRRHVRPSYNIVRHQSYN